MAPANRDLERTRALTADEKRLIIQALHNVQLRGTLDGLRPVIALAESIIEKLSVQGEESARREI